MLMLMRLTLNPFSQFSSINSKDTQNFTTIMEFRQNQGGEGGRAEADPAIKEGVQKGAYRFQEKKGSVFPVKKKLVKTMMAECISNSLSSKLGGSSDMIVTNTTPSKSSKSNKITTLKISPDP
ncbi:hypothetical protein ES288_A05G254500v1 [Gossypium darwinii]|nr:hypothetical protein ES288_A05G254500v1 [Gossypium darwinii]